MKTPIYCRHIRVSGIVFGLTVIMLGTHLAHAEYWYENFDNFSTGYVTQNTGWESTLGSGSSVRGIVSADNPYSSPHCLELTPCNTPYLERKAAYTNLSWSYGYGDNPIVRLSAKLYRDNNNQYLQIHVVDQGAVRLSIDTDTFDGTIRVNSHDSGVRFLTGQYAQLDLYYNMASNLVAMDYNGTNIVPWQDVGSTAFTGFDTVYFRRYDPDGVDSGRVLFDDVSIQTFADDTWAWWRFDESGPYFTSEQLGRFAPFTMNSDNDHVDAAWNWLQTDLQRVRNVGGFDWPKFGNRYNHHVFSATDWTLEFILRIQSDQYDFTLLEWGTGALPPTAAYQSRIRVFWNSADDELGVYLTDDDNSSILSQTITDMAVVPADEKWHHVALIKYGSQLNVFVDYDYKQYFALDYIAEDDYTFATSAWLCVCRNLSSSSSGNAYPNTVIDEVRISSDRLSTPDFLQLPAAAFSAMPDDPSASTWTFSIQTLPISTYALEYKPDLNTAGAWTQVTNFFGTNFISDVSISRPDADHPVFRTRRQ